MNEKYIQEPNQTPPTLFIPPTPHPCLALKLANASGLCLPPFDQLAISSPSAILSRLECAIPPPNGSFDRGTAGGDVAPLVAKKGFLPPGSGVETLRGCCCWPPPEKSCAAGATGGCCS